MEHRIETGGESPCDLARKLIAEGASRDDRIVMLRGGKSALSGGVGWFADHRVKETATFGPRYVKWKPIPDATLHALRASRPPKGK